MNIAVSKRDDDTCIALGGRMDAVSSPDFDRIIGKLMKDGERNFTLNMGDLEYISSAGLQSILAAAKHLEQIEGGITLSNLRGSVREVFEISGFDSLFPILD